MDREGKVVENSWIPKSWFTIRRKPSVLGIHQISEKVASQRERESKIGMSNKMMDEPSPHMNPKAASDVHVTFFELEL